MKTQAIYLTDLLLLRDLFAPGSDLYVLDPSKKLMGEQKGPCSGATGDPEAAPLLVADLQSSSMRLYLSNSDEGPWMEMAFINNPDGSIRWFFPNHSREAGHLSLYNAASLKSGLYKTLTRLAWKLGQGSFLFSGSFLVQQKLFETVQERYGMDDAESCSFFTGTRGATRKIVLHVQTGKRESAFIKIPLTKEAEKLVENEYNMVKTLSNYDFSTLSLPSISKRVNGHARLSDVKPRICISAERITAIHIAALAELYALSHERKALSETEAWSTLCSNMDFLNRELVFINTIDQTATLRLVELLRQLYLELPQGLTVPVSVSHGDFTPWNMYCDEQRLYVYDWEMARNGIPMLFDLFHFSYQSVILQQRKNYPEVRDAIHSWSRQPLVMHMIQKYGIKVQLHHALYLLFNVSHYVRQYLGEKELLMQSQWMITAWTAAIEDSLSMMKKSIK
ncbi:MAG: phosphotransferase [Bacteroidia bacterium]|nr:phosphotransferase [Bacteroidia bacterium]